MKGKVLIIDDEEIVCTGCKRSLEEEGYVVDYAVSAQDGVARALGQEWDVVLADLNLPGMSGMDVLTLIHRHKPDQPVIMITGFATIQTSIEAIKRGAFDYLPKPFTPEELEMSVARALEDRRIRTENEYLKETLYSVRSATPIIGRSKAIQEVFNQVLKIAPSEFTVIIYGESGTGKELIAHAMHENSPRRGKGFIAADISAISPTLVESELFGHVKGAFTGAIRSRPGFFAMADGGTLFLDEIANVNYELQGKLLRVVDTKRVRPVGGDSEQKTDIRLIAATNQDLFRLVQEGKFREDLYYRLSVIPLTMPPLRDRAEDVPLIAMHFLEAARKKSETALKGFSTEAMAKLISYRWPGNVRELKNIVERLAGTVDAELVRIEHLPAKISGIAPTVASLGMSAVPTTAAELKSSKRQLRDRVYDEVERSFVLNALERTGWNVTHAARTAGMQRTNFHALMRKHGIHKN